MNPTLLARLALPAFLVVFVLVAIAWPLARLYRRTGQVGVALSGQRTLGGLLVVIALCGLASAFGVWVLLFAALGPEPLGVLRAPGWVTLAGAALAAGGLAVIVISQAQMGASWRIGIDANPTALVEHGLYGVVRNPIYTGLLAALLGLTLITPAPWPVAGLLAAAGLIAVHVRAEERHLIALHGDAYLRYGARVGRFVPGLGRLCGAEGRA